MCAGQRKCKPVKNACKICLQHVKPKAGLQCQGACQSWVHYTCLNYTPGKIVDIKKGVVTVTCPCPDCKTIVPNMPISCNNYKCPANMAPSCKEETCQANEMTNSQPPPPYVSGKVLTCGEDCFQFNRNPNKLSSRITDPYMERHTVSGNGEDLGRYPDPRLYPQYPVQTAQAMGNIVRAVEQMSTTVQELSCQLNMMMASMNQEPARGPVPPQFMLASMNQGPARQGSAKQGSARQGPARGPGPTQYFQPVDSRKSYRPTPCLSSPGVPSLRVPSSDLNNPYCTKPCHCHHTSRGC